MTIAGFTIESNMMFIWIAALVIFIIIEVLSMGLTSIWFAIGAAGATVTAMAGGGIILQIIVFLVVSIVALAATRPWVKNKLNKELENTNVDALVGQTGIALTDIDMHGRGRVKADSKDWAASTESDNIKKDDRVVIVEVRGVTLIVKKEEI